MLCVNVADVRVSNAEMAAVYVKIPLTIAFSNSFTYSIYYIVTLNTTYYTNSF